MAAKGAISSSPVWRALRWAVWGGAAGLLSLPWIAMHYTTEVDWSPLDFVVMGGMLGFVCVAYELAVYRARTHVYVVAAGVAAATTFLITWINLAVGIIGHESNRANGMFFGVLVIGFIGVTLSRLEARRLARAMEVTAVAQGLATLVTAFLAEGYIFMLTGIFVGLWLISAQMFHAAARQEAAAGLTPGPSA
jgi:hypothetical protein